MYDLVLLRFLPQILLQRVLTSDHWGQYTEGERLVKSQWEPWFLGASMVTGLSSIWSNFQFFFSVGSGHFSYKVMFWVHIHDWTFALRYPYICLCLPSQKSLKSSTCNLQFPNWLFSLLKFLFSGLVHHSCSSFFSQLLLAKPSKEITLISSLHRQKPHTSIFQLLTRN